MRLSPLPHSSSLLTHTHPPTHARVRAPPLARTPCLVAPGIETVRRDNCLLVRTVIETCLKMILIDRSVPTAIAYTKQVRRRGARGCAKGRGFLLALWHC